MGGRRPGPEQGLDLELVGAGGRPCGGRVRYWGGRPGPDEEVEEAGAGRPGPKQDLEVERPGGRVGVGVWDCGCGGRVK